MEAPAETRWISCPKCSRRARPGQSFCELCGTRVRPAPPPDAPAGRRLHCESCGASVIIPETERTAACAFCGTAHVASGEVAPGRHPPEFVLPFAVPRAAAEGAFRSWMRLRGWFTPGDLALRGTLSALRGIYVPFWSFTMRSESAWQARIGEYWWETVTETYTAMVNGKAVTKTRSRRVRHTEWYPLQGRFHQFHSGYLVSASKGLEQALADRVNPFPVSEATRYAPHFLSGWMCEEYSIGREDAAAIAMGEFRAREGRDIAGFLPGDCHDDLSASTEFHDVSEDLLLVPVWILAYSYGKRTFRFLVNGATGKAHGEKPISLRRVVLWIVLLLALAGALLLLFAWVYHAGS